MTAAAPDQLDAKLLALRERMRSISTSESGDVLARAEGFLRRVAGSAPTVPTPRAADVSVPSMATEAPDKEISALPDRWAWMALIQRTPAMDRDRQVPCALEIEAGVFAKGILECTHVTGRDVRDEELQALVSAGQAAFDEMFVGNLRLVLYWAQRISRGDAEAMQDNFQEGCFGLYRAIQGWDALRGYAFSTYTTWHLRQSMDRGNANFNSVIRIPVHVQDKWGAATSSPGPLPELARYAWDLVNSLVSWEVLKEDRAWDRASRFAVPFEDEVGDEVEEEVLLDTGLSWLPDREAEVLRCRHGVGTEHPMTLDEIGEMFGLTRERIRQIESKALTRIRLYWINKSLVFQDWSNADPETQSVLNGAAIYSETTLKTIMRQTHWSQRQALDAVARTAGLVDLSTWFR